MKPKKDIKTTLRYKNMVANLKSQAPHVKEAALLKEIAGGTQWRMDAVIDAISARPEDWGAIDTVALFSHAGMFGRLSTVEKMSAALELKKETRVPAGEMIAAFHAAALHGHYRVADLAYDHGVRARHYREGYPHATHRIVIEGKQRKLDYLIKTGENVDAMLCSAAANGSRHTVEYLLSKGANPLPAQTRSALEIAVQYRRPDIALLMIAKIDTLADKNKEAVGNALYYAVDQQDARITQALLQKGAVVTDLILLHAAQKGMDLSTPVSGVKNAPKI